VSALLGKSGVTNVTITAGSLGGAPAPVLTKVRLDGYTPDDESLFREYYAPPAGASSATFAVPGLSRDGIVRVDALVRNAGAPPRRVYVVDAVDTVKLRPDLAVAGVQAPSVAWVHTPVIVTAALSEVNGDVGARATCVLDVDGTPVDSAVGIWVDAGGTVSCAFAHTFQTLGVHALAVRAASVDPADYDDANNVAARSVEIRREAALAYYQATADDDSVVSWHTFRRDFTTGGGYHEQGFDSTSTASRQQSASFDGYTREILAFPEEPLRDVRLRQTTGGAVVHEASYDLLAADNAFVSPDSSSGCVSRADGEAVATFTLCSARATHGGVTSSYTSVSYRWNAGDVTYRSQGYSSLFCLPYVSGCQPSSYSWNTTTPSAEGRRAAFGPSFVFDVGFTSGFTSFRATPSVSLAAAHSLTGVPYSCSTRWDYYPPAGRYGYITWCEGFAVERWLSSGRTTDGE